MKKRAKGSDRSAGYARDRMKLLLASERLGCSPQMMKTLKNDMIHTVKKYIRIEEEQVRLGISKDPCTLYAAFPLRTEEEPKKK